MLDDEGNYDVIARYTSEREVRAALEALTVAGIGATSDASEVPDPTSGKTIFSLLVVPGDGNRARSLLGLELEPEIEGESVRRRLPEWVVVLAVLLAAMIVIPLAAFFLSYKLSGG